MELTIFASLEQLAFSVIKVICVRKKPLMRRSWKYVVNFV